MCILVCVNARACECVCLQVRARACVRLCVFAYVCARLFILFFCILRYHYYIDLKLNNFDVKPDRNYTIRFNTIIIICYSFIRVLILYNKMFIALSVYMHAAKRTVK